MSTNKMLIDATHPEETRVVVLRNGRVEEFDYESAARKLLRGNIYLAKVTRVEPALQAAFVDYGGNRHGFLAFNEIHPDYYQIPMADRQALLDEEAAAEAEEEAAADARAERLARRSRGGRNRGGSDRSRPSLESTGDQGPDSVEPLSDEEHATLAEAVTTSAADILAEELPRESDTEIEEFDEPEVESEPESVGGFEPALDGENGSSADELEASGSDDEAADAEEPASADIDTRGEAGVAEVAASPTAAEAEAIEQVGAEDALEELPSRPRRRPRSYKIQEVIKRRQVILVQVVKEERGNKGAALTTYLSLAGRYTVLMPNTARGGGISRKITQPQDRKRLKAIAAELEVPEGMGLIIRTAGASRTMQEIKRDFEYLLRLWESVRDLTLRSQAPSLVYEEGNLIKRSIRDLYNKDVEEIIVAGVEAHGDAKDFMRMLMPSHAKHVVEHKDPEPIFARFRIEQQLNAMFSPYVTLRSGGYLVINQTEALVAVDVNSGKSTREFSIEETALNTNLEASDEIARQLKLRDLAGLIVIDFIDMEEKRNNRAVERRLKDALRYDRARIQLGHISHFGLMEMSRQRLRTGVLEGSTSQCPHCQGTGIIRSTESIALAVLRGLEDALMTGSRTSLIATTTSQVALYILNQKRAFITEMEARHGITISLQASEKLAGANFTIEKGAAPAQAPRRSERSNVVNMDWGFDGEEEQEFDEDGEADAGEDQEQAADGGERGGEPRAENGDGQDGSRRRRRRRRRGRRGDRPGDDGPRAQFDRTPGGEAEPDDEEFAAEPADPGAGDQPSVIDFDAAPEFAGEAGEAGETPADAPREEDRNRRGRRRGRRGGRRGRDRDRAPQSANGNGAEDTSDGGSNEAAQFERDDVSDATAPDVAPDNDSPPDSEPVVAEASKAPYAPRPRRREPRHAPEPAAAMEPVKSPSAEPEAAAEAPAESPREAAAAKPASRHRQRAATEPSEPRIERVVVTATGHKDDAAPAAEADAAAAAAQPARKGWWQRRIGGE